MAIDDIFNTGTQAVAQAGGMALQNHYNKKAEKRADKYERGLMDYQVQKQDQMNKQARKENQKMWNNTSYPAQIAMMKKAGLNPGLMYEGGGAGGTTGSAGGSAGKGSVQTHAPDAQSAMSGMGMALMNNALIQLTEAQTRKAEAETDKTIEETPGASADSRNKSMQADITEATYNNQVMKLNAEGRKAFGEAESATAKGDIDQQTVREKIQQEQLRTAQMGVELANKELNLQLTSAQIEETSKKIQKIVAEIDNMEKMSETARQNMLSQRMQVEFNTNTAAQIKQYTSIGTDILNATKGGGKKTTTINNDNRKSWDFSKETNHWE